MLQLSGTQMKHVQTWPVMAEANYLSVIVKWANLISTCASSASCHHLLAMRHSNNSCQSSSKVEQKKKCSPPSIVLGTVIYLNVVLLMFKGQPSSNKSAAKAAPTLISLAAAFVYNSRVFCGLSKRLGAVTSCSRFSAEIWSIQLPCKERGNNLHCLFTLLEGNDNVNTELFYAADVICLDHRRTLKRRVFVASFPSQHFWACFKTRSNSRCHFSWQIIFISYLFIFNYLVFSI